MSRETKFEKATKPPYFSDMYTKASPKNKLMPRHTIIFPTSFKSLSFIAI